MIYDEEIKKIMQAMSVAKRAGIRPPIKLARQLSVIHYLQQWLRKGKLAETKIRNYRRKLRRYQREVK